MKGMDTLEVEQQKAVTDTLQDALRVTTDTKAKVSVKPDTKSEKKVWNEEVQLPQPVQGKKTMAKGRVAWRFGGVITQVACFFHVFDYINNISQYS